MQLMSWLRNVNMESVLVLSLYPFLITKGTQAYIFSKPCISTWPSLTQFESNLLWYTSISNISASHHLHSSHHRDTINNKWSWNFWRNSHLLCGRFFSTMDYCSFHAVSFSKVSAGRQAQRFLTITNHTTN